MLETFICPIFGEVFEVLADGAKVGGTGAVDKEIVVGGRVFSRGLAQQRLEIDLDDGVKVNYLKFEGAVATIPGLAAKEN